MPKLKAEVTIRLLMEVASEDPTDGEEPRRFGIEAKLPAGRSDFSVFKVMDDLTEAGVKMMVDNNLFTKVETL